MRKKREANQKKNKREKNSLDCPKRKKKEKKEIASTSAATNYSSALKRTTKYTTLS